VVGQGELTFEEALKGMGGGHAGAAGANGKGKPDAGLKLCLKLFKDKLQL